MSDFRDSMIRELDDAALDFAAEDFAGTYGRGVVGRVRRRRTVRAAGVGGGTMLTAGALAIGVTQVPMGGSLAPGGSSDCVTDASEQSSPTTSDECNPPSPTPSPDPSLAGKPGDVVGDNPFECGFQFPTESYGTDDFWIDGVEWFTPSEVEAARVELYGAEAGAGLAGLNAVIPRVTVNRVGAPLTEGSSASGVTDTGSPSLDKTDNLALGFSAEWVFSEGRTFVGVVDGKVVATGTLQKDDEASAASILTEPDFDGATIRELMYLVDPSVALTSCDANPVGLTEIDIVAVAGVIVKHADGTVDGPTYAWLPVGAP